MAQAFSVANMAANDGYSENLDGKVVTPLAGVTASGTVAGLGAQQTAGASACDPSRDSPRCEQTGSTRPITG